MQLRLRKGMRAATWNVRTLRHDGGCEQLALSLLQYRVDVACLQELRLPGCGSIDLRTPHPIDSEDSLSSHRLLFSGPRDGSGQAGVGIAVTQSSQVLLWKPVSHRLAYARIAAAPINLSMITAYAPTNCADDVDKDAFYAELSNLIAAVPRSDVLVLAGDFNARVGARLSHEMKHVGPFVYNETRTDNGDRLTELAVSNDLCLISTMFRKKRHRLVTWKSNDHRTVSQIDHLLVSRRWRSSVMDVSTHWRKLTLCSDHALVVSQFRVRLCRRPKAQLPPKIDVAKLSQPAVQSCFQVALANRLATLDDNETAGIDNQWHDLATAMSGAAVESIGRLKHRTKVWITRRSLDAFKKRTDARDRGASREELRQLNRRVTEAVRRDRNEYFAQIAEECNNAARAGNSRKLFQTVKRLAGKRAVVSDSLCASDGTELKSTEEKVARWREYFTTLLNCAPPSRPLEGLTVEDPMQLPDGPPSAAEIAAVIKTLRNGKAAGGDGLAPELYRYGGNALIERLEMLLHNVWETERIPSAWRTAVIIPLHKKGDRAVCSNYRGISLLSIALKILEAVLLRRLRPKYDEKIARENQAGFRVSRGCCDQIFTLRQLIEMRYEYRKPTILVFIDFKAAFDSVDRSAIWAVAESVGVPAKTIRVLKGMYTDTLCRVRAYGSMSDSFVVDTGVRQGGVLSPFLFNMLIDCVMRIATAEPGVGGVDVQGQTERLYDLDYADDIVLLAESEKEAQLLLDRVSQTAARVGLVINSAKTKVMACSTSLVPKISLDGAVLEVVDYFTYLGSRLAPNGDASGEIRIRIGKASSVFLPLSKPLWGRRDVLLRVKRRVFDACVLSVLLYGCETWGTKSEDNRRLSSFIFRGFRRMLRIPVTARVPNADLAAMANWRLPIEGVLRERRLRWCGHVLRMDGARLARRVLLAEPRWLSDWRRPAVGPRLSWRRLVGQELADCFRCLRARHRRSVGQGLADSLRCLDMRPGLWRDSWPRQCVGAANDRDVWRAVIDFAVVQHP